MAHKTEIGKEIIGMLMFSLYSDPCTIFREYIQNSYDAIRMATEGDENGNILLESLNDGMISIKLDKGSRTITIEDNGTGIPMSVSEQRLKDVGRSIKRILRAMNKKQAGYFGVGRLVGAGYCRKLSFFTSAYGEDTATELIFDVDKIRSIMEDNSNEMLAGEVIDACTEFKQYSAEKDEHKFVVTLSGISQEYSSLLDHDTVKNYLVQVAPLAFGMMFKKVIKKGSQTCINYFNSLDYIRINLDDETDIKKAYSDIIVGTGDKIEGISIFEIKEADHLYAWGWYALTKFTKQIEDTEQSALTRGMRLRCQNLLIGDKDFLGGKKYFREPRGNEYFNGEVHIIDSAINPTTDRSDLEPTEEALRFKELLKEYFSKRLQPVYKAASEAKTAIEKFNVATIAKEKESQKEVTAKFSQEMKTASIQVQNEKIEEAAKKFKSLEAKKSKEETPQEVKDVLKLYTGTGTESISAAASNISTKKPSKKETDNTEKTMDTSLEDLMLKLHPKYSKKQVSVLKKSFKLMDKLFGKSNGDLVKTMQFSIINGLLQ